MRKAITPYIARAIFSQKSETRKRAKAEKVRQRRKEPHRVTVYIRINDAYSYVLLQVLKQLKERYAIEYDFRTVLNLQPDMFPAPKLWAENAFSDCKHLANLYADLLNFPAVPPSPKSGLDSQVTAQLLHSELKTEYLDNALSLFRAYWEGDDIALSRLLKPEVTQNVECFAHHLNANEARLQQNGHYLSAMMHYGGEWYWGINRLQYLERRFNELGIARKSQLGEVVFDRGHKGFCQMMSQSEVSLAKNLNVSDSPIEMFFSARSPYSYLGLIRARQLADHYKLRLIIKPVLPMVMRRMQVPKTKGGYITFDTAREARQHGIPFGFIADPLGTGVENTYALFDYAKSQNKEVEFLESIARGVWSEGIRADTEKGLSKMVVRAGLDWNVAKTYLSDDQWRNWAQDNLAELYSYGQWGVPCFKFQGLIVFGQDRLDRIETAISNTLGGLRPTG